MENQKGLVEVFAEKVWKFLSSVKLAVVLLVILAVVSVIGTVIQQNEAPETYLQEYSEATVRLFEALGFFDMYHTWWFVLLLFLFTANLTVCTLDRFPHTWKIIKAPLKPIEEDALRAVPCKREVIFKGGMEKAQEVAARTLQAHRYRFSESRGAGGAVQLMTQKGVYTRLGVYITHISILLIFTGALVGAFFGFKAFLNLPEGGASKYVYLRNEPMWDRIMDSLGLADSPVVYNPEGGVPAMPLDYFVYCNSFDVDYYINSDGIPTGMPSEYHSTLTVYDLNQQKILDKRIRVNDPLTFHGITFYQSSYGNIPDGSGKVVLNIRSKNTGPGGETIALDLGQAQYVPSIDRTVKAVGFSPYALRNPATGQVQFYQSRNDEFINPAVEIEVLKGAKTVFKTHLMKTDPRPSSLPEDYQIRFVQYWGARYTGLQVTKDPGVWIVYTGFILLCIGPLIAFFGSHKKLWVRIQDRKGQSVITVAGSSNRNRVGFEREFNRIVDEIAK